MIETDNTREARVLLAKYTEKPVEVRPITELQVPGRSGSVTYLGATETRPDRFVIWLSEATPEASFVHEIMHQVLRLEGFPPVGVDEDYARRTLPEAFFPVVGRLRNNLSSTLEHFELFPRLERDFTLDLESYYAAQVQQKFARFRRYSRSRSHPAFHFDRQEDILLGLDYFHWGSAAAPLLAHFKDQYAESARISALLFDKISALRPLGPSRAASAADLIKRTALEYGERKGLDPASLNVWRSVEVRQ